MQLIFGMKVHLAKDSFNHTASLYPQGHGSLGSYLTVGKVCGDSDNIIFFLEENTVLTKNEK